MGWSFDVVVGCETTNAVRDAMVKQGLRSVSCDMLPAKNGGPHFQGDVMDVLGMGGRL